MITLRLAASELRRLTAGRLPKLAVLALAVIPTLYAGLYLYANEDPYARLGEVPAAVVVQDRGATLTNSVQGTSQDVTYGEQVAGRLERDGGFGWVRTGRADALDGVRSGRYYSAVVIGPSFSADLVSTGSFQPRQATLTLVTNDANNYLASTIAERIADEVRDAIDTEVGEEATLEFLQGFAAIHADISTGVEGADRLVSGTGELVGGADRLASGSSQVASGAEQAADGAAQLAAGARELVEGQDESATGANELARGLATLRQRTSSLPQQTRALASGAQQVAEGNAQVAADGRQAAADARQVAAAAAQSSQEAAALVAQLQAQGSITPAEAEALSAGIADARTAVDSAASVVENASTQLDRLAAGSQEVASGASTLAGAAPALSQGIATAASGSGRLASGAAQLERGASELSRDLARLGRGTEEVADGAGEVSDGSVQLADGTTQVNAGATELRDGLAAGLERVPNLDEQTQQATARTVAQPVRVAQDALTSAGSYGAGLAPFFMSLATWIGAYVMFLVVEPLSRRSVAAVGPPWRTAVGGWLPGALLGVVQMACMLTLVVLALDIRPVYWAATAGLLVLASAAFVAVIQTLKVWFGAVGEFLGLVLLLVQLVTAGGTFPWQTVPDPLVALHRVMPMSYTVEGLRQTLYGGDLLTVARDGGVLLGLLLVALLSTTIAAYRQRRWTPTRLQPELVL